MGTTYLKIKPHVRLKIVNASSTRSEILEEVKDTIYYLPEDFKDGFKGLTLRIIPKRKAKGKYVVQANFNAYHNRINLFDFDWNDTAEYSQIFLHEFAHLLFDVMRDRALEIDAEHDWEDDGVAQNPYWEFVDEVNGKDINGKAIKPISNYSHREKSKIIKKDTFKRFEQRAEYAEELFAEYFGFTYSRYSNEEEVKGTLCNYIKLRNAFWRLIDGLHMGKMEK